MLAIHIYFNFTKLIFSFLSRRDIFFVIAELFGSILLVSLIFFFGETINMFFIQFSPFPTSISKFIYPLFCGLFYLLLSIFSRLLVKSNSEEVAKLKSEKGFFVFESGNEKFIKIDSIDSIIPLGIIDFSWLAIMGATYTALLYCTNFESLTKSIFPNGSVEYYKLYFEELNYLFGKALDIVLLLGTVLGVCMTILWGGELWRKQDKESKEQYFGSTIASIKMVVAYFFIAVSVCIWFIIPLYDKLTLIKYFLK